MGGARGGVGARGGASECVWGGGGGGGKIGDGAIKKKKVEDARNSGGWVEGGGDKMRIERCKEEKD